MKDKIKDKKETPQVKNTNPNAQKDKRPLDQQKNPYPQVKK